MRSIITTGLLSLFITVLSGQENTFIVNSKQWTSKDDAGTNIGMAINHKEILWDTIDQIFITHYPDFDTITYFNANYITRFHINERYATIGSCCATLDLLPEERAVLFQQADTNSDWNEGQFDSLRTLYYDDAVAIKFKKKKNADYKNQCAYSPDMAMFPFLVLLEKTRKDKWYYVPKGWYRTNFTTLAFLKVSDSLLTEFNKDDLDESEEIIEAGYLENVSFDCSIHYRFFHDEKLEIEYDPEERKIQVKIIESKKGRK